MIRLTQALLSAFDAMATPIWVWDVANDAVQWSNRAAAQAASASGGISDTHGASHALDISSATALGRLQRGESFAAAWTDVAGERRPGWLTPIVRADGARAYLLEGRLADSAIESGTRRALPIDTMFEHIDQGVSVFDGNLRLAAFNRRFLELMGLPVELGRIGTPFEAFIRYNVERGEYGPGDVDQMVRERVERARRCESHIFERVRPDGTVIEIRGNPLPGGGFVTTYADITRRKRTEEELQRTSQRLQDMNRQLDIALANMTQGLTLYDADNRLVIANRRYAELYNLPADLLRPGTALREIMEYSLSIGDHGAQEGEAVLAERLQLADDRKRRIVYQRLANGRVVELIHQPLPDGGSVATFTDVTDQERTQQALRASEDHLRERVSELEETRRRLEHQGRELGKLAENLSRARDEAETASRTKSEFLANMSHELRTPLNAVIGFSEIMKSEIFGPIGDHRYRDYAADVHASGRHLLDLINDILDLSKVEAGRLELRESRVDISQVTEVCERLMRERARNGGVRLVFDLPPQAPRVWADDVKLKQVLLNLVSNAIKFTPSGGKVTVAAGFDPDGALRLSVADTGIGMRPEEVPLALQPFRQIDNALTRKYSGTGLGLPLAKALIELHGGRLQIDSRPAVGTTVTIVLPARRRADDEAPPRHAAGRA